MAQGARTLLAVLLPVVIRKERRDGSDRDQVRTYLSYGHHLDAESWILVDGTLIRAKVLNAAGWCPLHRQTKRCEAWGRIDHRKKLITISAESADVAAAEQALRFAYPDFNVLVT